jgi:LmbE family N-acetylglucosaminyl deacetylase
VTVDTLPRLRVTTPVLAVSPHLDDAVMSCGSVLAQHPGAVVATVFAGRPPTGAEPTAWDRETGFDAGDDVIGCRRAEDRAALRELCAEPVWLDFRDTQYRDERDGTRGPDELDEIADAIVSLIGAYGAATVLAPLGLFHDDHRDTRLACLRAMERCDGPSWLLYADSPYRELPGETDDALDELRDRGIEPHLAARVRVEHDRKQRAVACYRSQLRALDAPGRPGHEDALHAEEYWWLTR